MIDKLKKIFYKHINEGNILHLTQEHMQEQQLGKSDTIISIECIEYKTKPSNPTVYIHYNTVYIVCLYISEGSGWNDYSIKHLN